MDYVVAMLVKRPYVVGLVVTFVVVAVAERGWRRMLLWLASATFIGWLSEYSSQRTGFPYGFYEYYPASFADEMWLSNVPLFASLSYAGLSYLGFSWTYTLLTRLRRGPHGIERIEDRRVRGSLELAVAASLMITWSDVVIDPITHLGEYWFLGKIYMYKGASVTPSWHFDVPFSNYLGWVLTFFTIVFANQRIDDVLAARGIDEAPGFDLPHRSLWSLGYFLGNFAFMLSVNLYLFFNPAVPAEKRVGWILLNTVVVSAAFVVFNLTILRRKLWAAA